MDKNLNADVYKYLPRNFKTVAGTMLYAILKAVNEQNKELESLIEEVIDQGFLSSASGIYLMRLGEQSGFTMPVNSGLDITAFRDLVPVMVSAPKQVIDIVNSLLEVFYSRSYVRPTVVSRISESYSVNNGDNLLIMTESGTASIVIIDTQVSDLSNVSASEIASVINAQQSLVIADTLLNERTGERFLRLVSKTVGVGAFVRILGGSLQNLLQFPYIVNLSYEVGTRFVLSKPIVYDNRLRVQWDGVGTDPHIFKIKTEDIVSFIGVNEKVNGSFKVIDSGYDYFVIHNESFDSTLGEIIIDRLNQIIVTDSRKNVLLDQREFAFATEIAKDTVTVTVPAVPPLVRRFTKGSMHLHGVVADVLSFSRTSMTVATNGIDIPDGDNNFILINQYTRPDFIDSIYKTRMASLDGDNATYTIDTSESMVLPFTTPRAIVGIYGEPRSDRFVLKSVTPHGLRNSWGFTLNASIGSGNVTLPILNSEHVVVNIIDDYSAEFKIGDLKYSGEPLGVFDVVRLSEVQSDLSDFYLEFSDESALVISGIAKGQIVSIDPMSGILHDTYTAATLYYRRLEVTRIEGNRAYIKTGISVGSEITVISNATGGRSGIIGGTVTYHVDTTSAHNQEFIFKYLKAVFLGYQKSTNPNYVGSFLFDPNGDVTELTVGRQIVDLSEPVRVGDNLYSLFVKNLNDFPRSGQLILNYGKHGVEGPIRFNTTIYNSTEGLSQILIDPAYEFIKDHPVGSSVQIVTALTHYKPGIDGADRPAYLTGTAQARETLFKLLRMLLASGIFIEPNVLFPQLDYVDPAINPYE